ncbi:ATP-binding protein [Streptomyces sp. H10-C2]|uniref:ATP-binding protein n=1 Tax=unclassified Streptomyces TaxID=2593676 RepID=UPI0024BB9A2C|nr:MULTISPECIES: ATP-binding protein [unclassified Streptomyces]MDJ0343910.1 ATP-binding protein [Streptomyces sp. PH10-H1]MDJ0373351.1 ATP-binding protein [Streptomyces sp. H10-C2]
MVRDESPPGEQRLSSALALLLPPAVTAVIAVVAVSVVPAEARVAVGWCGVTATLAVAVLAAVAVRRGRVIAALRIEHATGMEGLRRLLHEHEIQTLRLAEELLPEAVARLQKGETVDEALDRAGPVRPEHLAVMRWVLEAVDTEEGLREAAQRAFVNIARRVQAIVHQQAHATREMQERHGQDPDVLGDLMRLDHGTALVGRLADGIAVLGGARSGRQWSKAVPLYNVLRGAMSRILDYQRVDLQAVTQVAVVGRAVEPVIHALAELLDNATRYSPPNTRVILTASEVQAGIAIEIEDGGVSLSEEARERAERMLREAQSGIDLKDLGETPRLGLAVVGRLAQEYNLQVSLRPSAYGGVRAVVIVPTDLTTTTPLAGSLAGPLTGPDHGVGALAGGRHAAAVSSGSARRPALPAARPPVTGPVQANGTSPEYERTPNGLPQRRSRRAVTTEAQASAGRAAAESPPPSDQPTPPGLWLADFQRGVSGETSTTGPESQTSDTSSDRDE